MSEHPKQFVKAKPLESREKGSHARPPRQEKRKVNKKYEEKLYPQKEKREPIVFMLNLYQPAAKSPALAQLIKSYPAIFSPNPSKPEEETNIVFNEYLKYTARKQIPQKPTKQISSDSSDPDWDSDCEKQINLVSKKINESVAKKVQATLSKRSIKKSEQLQRHEQEFLEAERRKKRKEQEQQRINAPQPQSPNQKNTMDQEWDEYNPKVGALINEGLIKKIEQDEDEYDDDDEFSYADDPSQQSSKSSAGSDSDDEDDLFADEGPRTVVQKKIEEVGNKQVCDQGLKTSGTIVVNKRLFSNIARKVGVPESSMWVISNKTSMFKVSTHYMDVIYCQNNLFQHFPYVSLIHSEFVHNDEVETERGLEIFKKFNERRRGRKMPNNGHRSRNHAFNNLGPKHKPSHYKPKQ